MQMHPGPTGGPVDAIPMHLRPASHTPSPGARLVSPLFSLLFLISPLSSCLSPLCPLLSSLFSPLLSSISSPLSSLSFLLFSLPSHLSPLYIWRCGWTGRGECTHPEVTSPDTDTHVPQTRQDKEREA